MEQETQVKHSVAELAGMFKGQVLPKPSGVEGGRPVRRKPPCSLQLQAKKEGLEGDEEKSQIISSHPPKVKAKSSPLIEKLQANLALSPTGPSPGPKSPGMKVPILPFAMTPPGGPLSPGLRLPQRQLSEEEVPASFEKPAEGAVLPSINKGRARHSMKRRPPTRQHRKSCGDEGGAVGGPESPQQNGDEDDVFLEGSKDAVEAQEPTFPAEDSGGVAKDSPGNAEENAEEAQAEMTDAAPGDATSVEPQKDEAPTSAPEEVKEAGEEASGKPQASDIAPEALKALEAQTEPGPGAEEAAPAESQEEEEEEKGEEGEKTQAPEEREGKEEESKEKETEEQPKGTGE